MASSLKLLLVSIFFLASCANAFKILILYPTPSYSHQISVMSIAEGLVKKGHEVFFVSPNPIPGLGENYTFVDLSFSYKYFKKEENDEAVNLEQQISRWDFVKVFVPFAAVPEKQFISQPLVEFQRRVAAEQIKFDVAIIEFVGIPYTCGMTRLLGKLTNSTIPLISMSSIASDFYAERNLGSFHHLSYVPTIFDGYSNKMSLWQKIDNWFLFHWTVLQMEAALTERAKGFFRDTYGEASEGLVDGCFRNLSLSVISSNALYFYPRLLGPNVIEIGPVHLKTPEKLPENLQNWMDGAEKGVIYFSLGSNMKSKSLPAVVLDNFLRFFKQLPSGYRVLWKWEKDGNIPGQSDNILSQKWLPQHSVLAHPKIKVFITQGGLQSFQEAVHYGVPTVGIPWYGDQNTVVAKILDAQVGVRILPKELTSYSKIESGINAVLFDRRYSDNMKKLSLISHDFTSKSMENAIFWIEHVARHGGAPHLRPSTADSSYFEFLCLDILSVILVITTVVLYLLYFICKFTKLLVSNYFSSKEKKS
ncbi:unnamed protein product [Bemisia tabaci]|uniref:UDP-glucuronosyltransferase n=2 Tax=Bemisia tabaci TaxID=7038 RepID=A0A9P0F5J9_BEMTA|nr:unnamed protein product [Bemisia tabaci]